MKGFRRIFGMAAWACALTCVEVWAQGIAPHPLSPAEMKAATARLNPSLIPGYKDLFELQARQSFAVPAPSGGTLLLVPVRYNAERSFPTEGKQTGGECGLFTVRPDGGVHFTATYALDGKGPTQCDETGGVSFVARGAGQPPLALLYVQGSVHLGGGHSQDASLLTVLHWDPAAGGYVEDKPVEDRLNKLPKWPSTLISLKHVLASWKDAE